MKDYNNIIYYVIMYSLNDNEKKKVLKYNDNNTKFDIDEYDNFFELRKWFLYINNDNGTSWSKILGEKKSETHYAESLMKEYWGENINNDDQGIAYTEKLLTKYYAYGQAIVKLINNELKIQKYKTLGFDFDFFIYNEKEDNLLNIEFAYNKKHRLPNIKCHPMRYCWENYKDDNKRKYNNLWFATNQLGGKFAILNYTDEKNDKKSFELSIKECIDDKNKDLLCFKNNSNKIIHYDNKFFDNWYANNKEYK